jgi:hypothetical protein
MMKIHVKSAKSDVVLKNLSVLCDVEFIIGLPCMLNYLCVYLDKDCTRQRFFLVQLCELCQVGLTIIL